MLIGSLIIGVLAGWLANKLMHGNEKGCLLNLLIGLVGGFLGGKLLGWLGMESDPTWIGELGTSVVGAVLLLAFASLFQRKK